LNCALAVPALPVVPPPEVLTALAMFRWSGPSLKSIDSEDKLRMALDHR
jgi:hypothetical protein